MSKRDVVDTEKKVEDLGRKRVEIGHESVKLTSENPSIRGIFEGTEPREGKGTQAGTTITVILLRTETGRVSIRQSELLRDRMANVKVGDEIEIVLTGTTKSAKGTANLYRVYKYE